MSLKVKLKRAFSKALKFLIINLVFLLLICFVAVPVFAESVIKNVDVTVQKVQVELLTETSDSYSSWFSLYPQDIQSPYGGTFQCAKIPDTYYSNHATRWDMSFVFNTISLQPDRKYTFHFKFAMSADKLTTSYDYMNVFGITARLLDPDLKCVYDYGYSNSGNISSWSIKKVEYFNVNFAFYDVQFSFSPSKVTKVHSISMYLAFRDVNYPVNTRGNFGLSDFTLSYDDNPLTDPNYKSADSGSVEDHNALTGQIDDQTAEGRNDAVTIMDLSSDSFIDIFYGLNVWTLFINNTLQDLSWYETLLEFSLGVGMFAFLLGLAIYAVGKVGSKDSSGKNLGKGKGGSG